MSILEKMNKAMEKIDTSSMEEILHNDFEFYFHSSGDPLFNQKLKKVIYPLLYAKKKIIAPKFEQYVPIFYEVPLLFEEQLTQDFDATIFISANPTKRKQRVLSRGDSTNYFQLMNQKQIKENIKENLSDFTINNNGSILNLRLNIIKFLHSLWEK